MIVAVAVSLAACRPDPGLPPRPALYEVTARGGGRGWVFGTVHALPPELEWSTPALDAALAGADSLVLEIATPAEGEEARRTFLALGTSPGLPPLEERVAPARRSALAGALRQARLDPASLRPLENWAAALTLSQALGAGRGLDSASGVEPALVARAGPRPVVGLESFAGQLGVFDALPPAAQRALLEAVVAESADPDRGERLVEAWRRGDLAVLAEEARTGMLADPVLRDALLVARNRAWADRIDPLLRAGQRPFVAVGAGHVAGPDGLPALLAARGLTVRRIQ